MHEILHTDAIVLCSRASGEADKVLTLFTREFGVIVAEARGIRKVESKLRMSLQDFARARVGLVEGRRRWRLTTAEPISFLEGGEEGRAMRALFARMARLLSRLYRGPAPHPELYDDLIALFSKPKDSATPDIKSLEVVAALRILYHLGYIEHTATLLPFVEGPLSKIILTDAYLHRKTLLKTINESLRESQL